MTAFPDPFAHAQPADEPRKWACPAHGVEYGDGLPDQGRMVWNCPECEREASHAGRALRAEHARFDWWRDYSGIPQRYRAAVPASIQPVSPSGKALARAVTAYVANLQERYDAGDGLILIGPPGLGKTLALAAIVNSACAVWRGPIYACLPAVLAEVKAGFGGPKDDPRRQAIERLMDAPLLALDELGVRGMSDWEHGEVFRLIDHRYAAQLPTLVAANATPANFATLVGERIADRLKETGPMLVLTGESQRGQLSVNGPDALQEPAGKLSIRRHEHGQWRERVVSMERGW